MPARPSTVATLSSFCTGVGGVVGLGDERVFRDLGGDFGNFVGVFHFDAIRVGQRCWRG